MTPDSPADVGEYFGVGSIGLGEVVANGTGKGLKLVRNGNGNGGDPN